MHTSYRLLVAGFAVAVGALGVAAPAAAATPPPQPVTAPAPQQTDCAHAVASLPKLAAAGVPDAECAEPRDRPTGRAIASLVSKAPAEVPRWCLQRAFTGWWATADQACSIQDWFLKVYDTSTAEVVGTMGFLVINRSGPATGGDAWQQSMILRSYARSGAVDGATNAYGLAYCEGNCDLDEFSFPRQTLTAGVDVVGKATFAAYSAGPIDSEVTFLLSNPAWFTPGIFSTVASPRGLCDATITCTFP